MIAVLAAVFCHSIGLALVVYAFEVSNEGAMWCGAILTILPILAAAFQHGP